MNEREPQLDRPITLAEPIAQQDQGITFGADFTAEAHNDVDDLSAGVLEAQGN